jgi:hypothetical protein
MWSKEGYQSMIHPHLLQRLSRRFSHCILSQHFPYEDIESRPQNQGIRALTAHCPVIGIKNRIEPPQKRTP